MDRFFITGLPRSRTAWFAVATSTDAAVCRHEPSAEVRSYGDLLACWAPGTGISDSALALFTGRILADVRPRTLIIERDIDQVVDSITKNVCFPAEPRFRELRILLQRSQIELDRWKSHPLVRTVKFDRLDSTSEIDAAFDWLMPGVPRPALSQLAHMNIQADVNHKRELLRRAGPAALWVLNPQ